MRRLLPILLLLLLLGGSCSSGDSPGREIGTRAVVIGIDSADWKIIDQMVAEGDLPIFASLIERGTRGDLETVHDIPLSPVIWTSIATGKTAEEHGITWFLVDQPDGTRVPVRSTNRRVEAIWNIVDRAGRTWSSNKCVSIYASDTRIPMLARYLRGALTLRQRLLWARRSRRGNPRIKALPGDILGDRIAPSAQLGRVFYLIRAEQSAVEISPATPAAPAAPRSASSTAAAARPAPGCWRSSAAISKRRRCAR